MSAELTMAMMLVLTVGAAVYVAWPLLVGRTQPEEYLGAEPDEPALQQLMFQRDTTYAAMKELDFDYAMGNLSKEDYQELQNRYKRKAVALLKRIDDLKAGRISARRALAETGDEVDLQPLPRPQPRAVSRVQETRADLDVEEEIESFRRGSRAQPGAGKTPQAVPGTLAGSSRPALCPSCGRPIKDPEAVFCARCGAPVRSSAGQKRKRSTGVKGDNNGSYR